MGSLALTTVVALTFGNLTEDPRPVRESESVFEMTRIRTPARREMRSIAYFKYSPSPSTMFHDPQSKLRVFPNSQAYK